MDVQLIKKNAKEYFLTYRTSFVIVLCIITFLQCIPLFLEDIPFDISGLFAITMIPIQHGIIVTTLRMIRNRETEITKSDAFIGLRRYKELFKTYVIYKTVPVVVYFIPFIIVVIMGLYYLNSHHIDLMEINYVYLMSHLSGIIIQFFVDHPFYIVLVVIGYLLLVVISALIDGYLLAVPYLLEEYHMTGMDAIWKSYHLMNYHMKDYMKMYFSFLPFVLILGILEIVMTLVFRFQYTALITFMIGILGILLYRGVFVICQAEFYSEVLDM